VPVVERDDWRAATRCFVRMSTETCTGVEKERVFGDAKSVEANRQHGMPTLTAS
jgi:hypothetical protein